MPLCGESELVHGEWVRPAQQLDNEVYKAFNVPSNFSDIVKTNLHLPVKNAKTSHASQMAKHYLDQLQRHPPDDG